MEQFMTEVGEVVRVWGTLSVLGGILALFYNIRKRFEGMESDKVARKEENRLILRGLFACLDGLHQKECNGEVTRCHQELLLYLTEHRN